MDDERNVEPRKAEENPLIFLHGLESSSLSEKAVMLRGMFPWILTPDFTGSLDERMETLYEILGDSSGWTIIGSSFGGLMAAIFTLQRPRQVRRLVLLAPALDTPLFPYANEAPVDTPGVVYHGTQDDVVPLEPVRLAVERIFPNLEFHAVDDQHRLRKTVPNLDWGSILGLVE